MNSLKDKKVLIVVPAYNEEGSIAQTVAAIRRVPLPLHILVINDGSTDRTAQCAKEAQAMVISLPFNLGIGGAVQTGFKYAKENWYDILVQVDADNQHDVSFLESLIMPIINERADIVIGSRFLPPNIGYQSSFVRRIGIHFFAWLIRLLTGYHVTDSTSGFRAYNYKMIKAFAKYYPQDFPEPEAILVAKRYQARIEEIPVQMRERMHGASSIRYLKTLYYMIKVTFAILLDKLKSKPKG